MRITGWLSPSGVSTRTILGGRRFFVAGRRTAPAPIAQLDRQHRLERRANHAALLERAAAEHEQAAAAFGDEIGGQRQAARG